MLLPGACNEPHGVGAQSSCCEQSPTQAALAQLCCTFALCPVPLILPLLGRVCTCFPSRQWQWQLAPHCYLERASAAEVMLTLVLLLYLAQIGTACVTRGNDNRLALGRLGALVEQIEALVRSGRQVILVTSGRRLAPVHRG